MVWGHRDRGAFDAITAEGDFVCSECPYVGHLLLRRTEGRSHLFLIPTGPWRTVSGTMSCPLCSHTVHLSRRQYEALDKCEGSYELVAVQEEIEKTVERVRREAEFTTKSSDARSSARPTKQRRKSIEAARHPEPPMKPLY
jgi:hypothetical protein